MKFIILILITVLATSCSSSNQKLEEKLNQQLQPVRALTHGYSIVNLDSLVSFDWDTVHFFSSDDSTPISSEEISRTLGFHWPGPELHYQMHRMIFTKRGEVVDFVDFDDGDFVSFDGLDQKVSKGLPFKFINCGGAGVTRKNAHFAAVHSCYEGYDHIYLIPLNCLRENRHIVDDTGCANWPAQLARRQAIEDSVKQAQASANH